MQYKAPSRHGSTTLTVPTLQESRWLPPSLRCATSSESRTSACIGHRLQSRDGKVPFILLPLRGAADTHLPSTGCTSGVVYPSAREGGEGAPSLPTSAIQVQQSNYLCCVLNAYLISGLYIAAVPALWAFSDDTLVQGLSKFALIVSAADPWLCPCPWLCPWLWLWPWPAAFLPTSEGLYLSFPPHPSYINAFASA